MVKVETQVGLFILVAIGIFFYLSVNIGALRFDGSSYHTYKVYFGDTRGLERKSSVKIAGVSVGRVEKVTLMESGIAETVVSVLRTQKLFRNSYATITQDNLIGGSTLEVDPGDSSSGILPPGSTLSIPGKASAKVADIIESFKEITDTVQDVVSSFRGVFATPEGEKMMSSALEHAFQATEKMSHFSVKLNDLVEDNDEKINQTFGNINSASENVKTMVKSLEGKTDKFADNAVDTSESFRRGGKNFDKSLKNLEVISEKLINGEGSLGKLLCDDELYNDVRDTVSEVKKFVGQYRDLSLNVDLYMASYYPTKNNRGVAELRIAPESDYYYSLQLSSDRTGLVSRKSTSLTHIDKEGSMLNTKDPELRLVDQIEFSQIKDEVTSVPGGPLVGFQFCKKFNDLTMRIGLIENTFGAGMEYDFSVYFKDFRWVVGAEAFDFNGYNRRETDTRPHVRFFNRLFIIKNMYTYFGYDDIFSKRNSAFFLGGGITFDDDSLKPLLAMLPLGKFAGG